MLILWKVWPDHKKCDKWTWSSHIHTYHTQLTTHPCRSQSLTVNWLLPSVSLARAIHPPSHRPGFLSYAQFSWQFTSIHSCHNNSMIELSQIILDNPNTNLNGNIHVHEAPTDLYSISTMSFPTLFSSFLFSSFKRAESPAHGRRHRERSIIRA